MPQVLIIGYGNELRADDGLGPAVIDAMDSEPAGEGVRTLSRQLLTPDLAEPVSRADLVVFIDASVEGTPGELRCEHLEPDRCRTSSFTHHFDPAGLVALGEALYDRAPEAYVISVCGQSFEYEEGLTEAVAARVPDVVARVRTLVGKALTDTA